MVRRVEGLVGEESIPGDRQSAFLGEIALVVIPSMLFTGLSRPDIGGPVFFFSLLLSLARHVFFKRPLAYMCLALSSLPVQMLLRDYFYYNTTLLILSLGLGLWVVTNPKEFSRLWGNLRWRCLALFGILYWLSSFYLTGSYSANFRTLELVMSVAAIYLLARRRRVLATTFRGMGLVVVAINFASLSYASRPEDGWALANPITFGVPLALVLLLSIADKGKWLMIDRRPVIRLSLILSTVSFLVLSTSRGSWAVVVVCLLALLFDHKHRENLILPMILGSVLIVALLSTGRGQVAEKLFGKVVSSESTLTQKTSGRSDQWALFPHVFMDSPIIGFGPGSGRFVYGIYSIEHDTSFQRGAWMGWHSLYMHLGVEMGLVGLILLAIFVIPLVLEKSMHWRLYGESVPFIGLLGFLIITLSTSGLDAISGVFLGLGFLGGQPQRLRELFKTGYTKAYKMQILSKELAAEHVEQLEIIDAQSNTEPWSMFQWMLDLPLKWQLSWVVMRGEEPVGFLVASRKDDAIHVHRLAFTHSERRKNLGRILLAASAWRSLNTGCEKITLKVHRANIGAIAFYTRLGFVCVGHQNENLLLTAESSRVFDLS